MTFLFQGGKHFLHSGDRSPWLIDVDALSEESIRAAAEWLASFLPPYKSARGVPEGGLRLAEAMREFASKDGAALLVDDVLTTGASMEQERRPGEVGAVLFSRGPCPDWVTPLFTLFTLSGERKEDR